jgi:hypothetical protein
VASQFGNGDAAAMARARAAIPLARTVCDLRSKGNDDFQAARVLWKANIVNTLGLAGGSELTLESDTLQVVSIAEDAYCPQYSSGNY